MRLKDVFYVKSRFHRSVHVELDSSLEGYIVTQAGVRLIERIADNLVQPHGTKAWTITGPYGSGKSAFVVFLKSLLGKKQDPNTQQSRRLLSKADTRVARKLLKPGQGLAGSEKGYCHAVASAGRESVELAIAKALRHGLEDFFRAPKKPRILDEVYELLKRCERGHVPETGEVVSLCLKAREAVEKARGSGLLLVIDELGKCLEAAALEPKADIFVLQQLAEVASRSQACPLLLFTVLHQSFDRYAARLDAEKKREWSKVQGRFEDVAFVHSGEQTLRLIGAALEPRQRRFTREFQSDAEPVYGLFHEIVQHDHHRSSKSYLGLLRSCLPLHPLTAVVLPTLFKGKFSQNERSLFAFLSSTEPHGFMDFLGRTEINVDRPVPTLFGLEHLYDYLMANFGVQLFSQSNGRRWVEIDNALSRSTIELERIIIKVIGMLSIVREASGFPIDEKVIHCALSGAAEVDRRKIQDALSSLGRKSIIIYRRFASSYVVWGGSDIDLEERVQGVIQGRFQGADVIEELNRMFPLRPRIAKRHLYDTGTLRYFEVRYVQADRLEKVLQKPIADADGQILFTVSPDKEKRRSIEDLERVLREARPDIARRTVIVLSSADEHLLREFTELLALHHVKNNTSELQGDDIARRELEARIMQLERLVSETTDEVFFPRSVKHQLKAYWIDGDRFKMERNISKRALSAWISDICDRVYAKAPVLKNELLNRTRISPAAALARLNLLYRMLEHSTEAALGMQGFPPEYSMYLSALKRSGIHRQRGNEPWAFAQDQTRLEESWKALWMDLRNYLEKYEFRKIPVTELYDWLKAPPYGIREGVLPVLLVAVLKANESQIALFEHGTFNPAVKSSDIDMLIKWPQHHALQLCRISGIKAVVFEEMIKAFVEGPPGRRRLSLLDVVRMLCQFARRLPNYVKKTSTVSSHARQVREALLESREPAGLLYCELPKACGFEPFERKGKRVSAQVAKAFVAELKQCIAEIQRKEVELFAKIESIILQAFSVDTYSKDQRALVTERAARVLLVTLDPLLKGLLVRVTDSLEHRAWLSSVGTVVVGKPPVDWTDDELVSFEQQMAAFSSKFARYERLVIEMGKTAPGAHDEVVQLSVTSTREVERFKILRIAPEQKAKMLDVEEKIKQLIVQEGLEGDLELVLGGLSHYARHVIEQHTSVQNRTARGRRMTKKQGLT